MKRLNSIDFVRGLVMIIMALDHTRDLMHVTSLTQNPTDLSTTTPALFLTRWVTHFCAPIFVFLAGTSVYLSSQRQNELAATRSFLWRRGLWLIVLEFTLINFAIWFDPHFGTLIFQVIAAIGCGFLVLALLAGRSVRTLGLLGALIVAGHNLLPLLPLSNGSPVKLVLQPLFAVSAYPLTKHLTFVMAYPPIPWLGILLLGYAAGPLFERPAAVQSKLLLRLGGGALALFALLRWSNLYGDPSKWSGQRTGLLTALSFLNVTKYPPSLLFSLLTLGVMFLGLAWAAKAPPVLNRFMTVYGQVPLFYYLLHFYLLHVLMFGMVFWQGYGWSELVFGFNFGRPQSGSGVGLGAIYLIWLAVVLSLFPLCRWYGEYKSRHRDREWLRYL